MASPLSASWQIGCSMLVWPPQGHIEMHRTPILLTVNNQTLTKIRARISNYIFLKHYDAITHLCLIPTWFNSSLQSVAYMHCWTRSALDQIMVCCFFCIKPLPELQLAYCQLEPEKQISAKFEWKYKFSFMKRHFVIFVKGEMSWVNHHGGKGWINNCIPSIYLDVITYLCTQEGHIQWHKMDN